MVDKFKRGAKLTHELIEYAYLTAMVAAAIKVATLPAVQTAHWKLPLWQAVAGMLLAGVVNTIHNNRKD